MIGIISRGIVIKNMRVVSMSSIVRFSFFTTNIVVIMACMVITVVGINIIIIGVVPTLAQELQSYVRGHHH